MRVAVYMGSFAPLHLGHEGIVRHILKNRLADRVLMVPTPDYWDKQVAYPLAKRIECIRTICGDNVWCVEKYCKYVYTFELMEALIQDFPHDEFLLVLGADNLPKFDEWKKNQFLKDNFKFIVVRRDNYDVPSLMKKLKKDDYFILNCPLYDVSSSFIRANLANYDLLKDKLSFKVYEIIKDKSVI